MNTKKAKRLYVISPINCSKHIAYLFKFTLSSHWYAERGEFEPYKTAENHKIQVKLKNLANRNYQLQYLKKWKNGSFRNREDLPHQETADSVLLSLFMRTKWELQQFSRPLAPA